MNPPWPPQQPQQPPPAASRQGYPPPPGSAGGAPPAAPPPRPPPGKKRARMPWEAAVVSALFHIGILTGAGFLTVLVISQQPKAMFEAKKPPSVPPRKLEHTIRVKQMQKQVRKPQILQRLVTRQPSDLALPELPKLEAPDLKTLRETPTLMAEAGSALGSLGGSGGGAGRGLTGGSGYSDTKFFGENVRTRAIIICMDISPSMVAKGVVEDVREQTKDMLQNLSPVTKFNISVFVEGADGFSEEMVFATSENKDKALSWLAQDFNPRSQGQKHGYSGSTPGDAIRTAVEQGCDTMFILSDDPPYLKKGGARTGVELVDHKETITDYVEEIESRFGRRVKINPIVYKPHRNERGEEGKRFYRRLARKTGGRFQVVD